ncbi:MAG: hypothetical protein JNM00_04705, partial [Flavobacteriales bacterium]|nr:hypothetical protein [Flavobacteriales bacterium]
WVSDTVAAELSYIQLRTGYGVGVKLDENHLYTQVFGFFDYQHASYQLKDSLFFEYRRQQDLLDVNADAYYDIPADDRLSLKDLNQDKTEIFNLGVGINFGFSIGEERGFVFYITPSIKYGVYRHKNLLHNISWGSAGLAGEMSVALGFGGNMNKMISVTRN